MLSYMALNVSAPTLEAIHKAYNKALLSSRYLQDIPRVMYQLLREELTIPEEEQDAFWVFMDGLKNCFMERDLTFEITEFITDLNSVIMQIIRYMNTVYNAGIVMNWCARQKALVSDFKKIATKAFSAIDPDSVCIRDRFGLRGILLNRDVSEEEKIEQIYEIYKMIRAILTQDSPIKEKFLLWIGEHSNQLVRLKVETFLSSVTLAVSNVHDYIKHPKKNGYMSLQFTLRVNNYSKILPGSMLEIQLRTSLMDDRAEGRIVESKGQDQSHTSYKKELDPRLEDVFSIDPKKSDKIQLVGYYPKGPDHLGLGSSIRVAELMLL